jgi:formylglycine-generating enzyme required for sulfatase activity
MGNPLEEGETKHRVRITRPFYRGKYEVTQAQYEAVTGMNLSRFKGAELPVEQVSWDDATEFCRKLTAKCVEVGTRRHAAAGAPGNGDTTSDTLQSQDERDTVLAAAARSRRVPIAVVRLPTEAEWEYACRAGTTTPFHYGESLGSDQANFNGHFPYGGAAEGTYREKTTSVGSFAANAWGLHDMHGNVYEWCADWYDEGYYANSPRENPTGPRNGSSRVVRGGGWYVNGFYCRFGKRRGFAPTYRHIGIGFRVVASPSPR